MNGGGPALLSIVKISDAWDDAAEADNLYRMARELRARGHAVVVACTAGTPLARRAAGAGIETRTLPGLRPRGNPIAFARGLAAARALVRALRPQVVHAYRSPPHWLSAFACAGLDGTRLVRTRGTMVPPRRGPLNRWLLARTDLTIVTAEAVRRQYLEKGFDASRLVTVYGALELDRFDPAAHDGRAVRGRLGIPLDAPVVGHLARLAPVKGHRHLLDAMPGLLRWNPETRLVLAGPPRGGMEATIRVWARELGIADRVLFLGAVEDVPSTLSAFDVGVVASVGSEALSRAAIEYLAMAIPVVATRVGSLPELVDDGRTGRLVPPGDAAALEAALRSILQEAGRRQAWSAAARADAVRRFGAAAQAERLESLYRSLVYGASVGTDRSAG